MFKAESSDFTTLVYDTVGDCGTTSPDASLELRPLPGTIARVRNSERPLMHNRSLWSLTAAACVAGAAAFAPALNVRRLARTGRAATAGCPLRMCAWNGNDEEGEHTPPDVLAAKVDSILEVTPIKLMVSYFEHAFEAEASARPIDQMEAMYASYAVENPADNGWRSAGLPYGPAPTQSPSAECTPPPPPPSPHYRSHTAGPDSLRRARTAGPESHGSEGNLHSYKAPVEDAEDVMRRVRKMQDEDRPYP